ncbi:MAG TPA: hypothetical protein VFU47_10370, partial [Armatimonadota bacterium]|nr:hypothetical protein [Armatimonadota bacterium]
MNAARGRDDRWLFQPDFEAHHRTVREPAGRSRRMAYRIAAGLFGLTCGWLWWHAWQAPRLERKAPRPHSAAARHARRHVPVHSRVAGWRASVDQPGQEAPRTWKEVWVTAYCPECPICDTGDLTATGTSAETRGVAV